VWRDKHKPRLGILKIYEIIRNIRYDIVRKWGFARIPDNLFIEETVINRFHIG
jgi:hypothetical protein